MGQIWGFRAFWSCSVDFPHYDDPLTGHIWGFWALSGERVGVNIGGGAEAYSHALRRVLSSCYLDTYQWLSTRLQ